MRRNKAWRIILELEASGLLRWWVDDPSAYPTLGGRGYYDAEEFAQACRREESRRLAATWPWTYIPLPEGPHDYPATMEQAFRPVERLSFD